MSTRSQIRIVLNGYPLNFYHHHDGYYSGVGKDLQNWLMNAKHNAKGEEYDKCVYLLDRMKEEGGYEVTFFNHWDIEYFYLIDFDNRRFKAYDVHCTPVWYDEDDENYDSDMPWYNQMPNSIGMKNLMTDEMAD